MNIRKAKAEDITQLLQLKKPQTEHHVNIFHNNQIQRLKAAENNEAIYLVVEENNQIIAHLLLKMKVSSIELNYPNINDLYVAEHKRRRGIGSKLVQEAERIVKEKGYKKIFLAVNPTLNTQAIALYERLGYSQTTASPYLDGVYDGNEDWVVDMIKELS